MKKYWGECNSCPMYANGNKVHKKVCYDCGECSSEGVPPFCEEISPNMVSYYRKKYWEKFNENYNNKTIINQISMKKDE